MSNDDCCTCDNCSENYNYNEPHETCEICDSSFCYSCTFNINFKDENGNYLEPKFTDQPHPKYSWQKMPDLESEETKEYIKRCPICSMRVISDKKLLDFLLARYNTSRERLEDEYRKIFR